MAITRKQMFYRLLYVAWLLALGMLGLVAYQWMWWAGMFCVVALFASLSPLLEAWQEGRNRRAGR